MVTSNPHRLTVPGMPRIVHLAAIGAMDVMLPSCTMAAARICRWAPASRSHQLSRSSSQNRLRDIVAGNRIPFGAHQSWVDCITNIRLRLPALDQLIADHNQAISITLADRSRPSPGFRSVAIHSAHTRIEPMYRLQSGERSRTRAEFPFSLRLT